MTKKKEWAVSKYNVYELIRFEHMAILHFKQRKTCDIWVRGEIIYVQYNSCKQYNNIGVLQKVLNVSIKIKWSFIQNIHLLLYLSVK